MATVTVGQDKFCVHENLICQHSGYLKAAFSGMTEERTTRSVSLDSFEWHHKSFFGIFVHWVYHQQIEFFEDPAFGDDNDQRLFRNCSMLVRAWGLGGKLLAPRFQNDVVDKLFKNVPDLPTQSLARLMDIMQRKEIYKKPYRLLMDHIALKLSTEELMEFSDVHESLNPHCGDGAWEMDLVLVLKDYQTKGADYRAPTAESYHVPLPGVKQEGTSKAQAGS